MSHCHIFCLFLKCLQKHQSVYSALIKCSLKFRNMNCCLLLDCLLKCQPLPHCQKLHDDVVFPVIMVNILLCILQMSTSAVRVMEGVTTSATTRWAVTDVPATRATCCQDDTCVMVGYSHKLMSHIGSSVSAHQL